MHQPPATRFAVSCICASLPRIYRNMFGLYVLVGGLLVVVPISHNHAIWSVRQLFFALQDTNHWYLCALVPLGNSGLKIILGCMTCGKRTWLPWLLKDEEESIRQIKAAYDAGINTFDTANVGLFIRLSEFFMWLTRLVCRATRMAIPKSCSARRSNNTHCRARKLWL